MKRISVCLISLLLTVVFICGCAKAEPAQQPSDSAPESETEQVNTLKFNDDLFADLGLTFSQLHDKRGEVTEARQFWGGTGFYYKNGLGLYMFISSDYVYYDPETGKENSFKEDENGKVLTDESPVLLPSAVCGFMYYVSYNSLFITDESSIPVSEIEKLNEIKEFETYETGYDFNLREYTTSFYVGDILVMIQHDDKACIDADSFIFLQDFTVPEKQNSIPPASDKEQNVINDEFINDFQLTYPELCEKYGAVTRAFYRSGDPSYIFENGNGVYAWRYTQYSSEIDPETGAEKPFKLDADGNMDIEQSPQLKEGETCRGIFFVPTDVFFTGWDKSIKTSEISSVESIKNLKTYNSVLNLNDGDYITEFEYRGCKVGIQHKDKDIIDSDALIFVCR